MVCDYYRIVWGEMEQTRGKSLYPWFIDHANLQKKEVNHDDSPLWLLTILIISHGRFQVLNDDFQRFEFRWSAILKEFRDFV